MRFDRGSEILFPTSFLKGSDLFLCFFLGNAVLLLYLPHKLVALSGNHIQLIVSEFAPLLLHFPLELFPVSFNLIPIHVRAPFSME